MTDTNQALQDAFSFIEEGRLDEARQVLLPLIEQNPDDPDVWWVYAHAVEDPAEGKEALRKVMALRPDYPGASALASLIESDLESPPESKQLPADDRQPATPVVDSQPSSGGNRTRLLIAIIAIVALVGVALVLLNSGNNQPEPAEIAQATDTAPVIVPQESPVDAMTETEAVVSTEDVDTTDVVDDPATATADTVASETTPDADSSATPAPTEDVSTTVTEATADADSSTTATTPTETETEQASPTETEREDATASANVAPTEADENGSVALSDVIAALVETGDPVLEERTTDLGNTLIANVCSFPGPAASATIEQVMTTLADEIDQIDADAVAVAVTNCDADQVLRVVAVPLDVLRDFADASINLATFRGQWQPVD